MTRLQGLAEKLAVADVTVEPVQKSNLTRNIAAAKDSRFLTAEAVRNNKGFGMGEDSQVEIQAHIKKDVIPNRAEGPVRACPFDRLRASSELAEGNLLFAAYE